ncbi:MAG: DUF4382 domain-containing protein [Gammaproteobacteria bacterium]|nr:DUF4382 domain-containing protein [Gammaproteobacteria bacterium]
MSSLRPTLAIRTFRAPILALMLSLLMACGGGSGGGTVTAPPPVGDGGGNGSGGTGSLGLTIGDNPIEDFDEILVTVLSVSLLGNDNDEPLLLTEETFTFDLLALDAATELLVAADGVPAGDYSKIRLQLESIELRRLDEDGELDGEPVQATLVANGKLDLNPRGQFTIQDGGALIVQLDIDAGRSFLAVQAGPGQIRFRPQVFVDILGDGDLRRITFLTGNVALLAPPEGDTSFDLCDARALTGRGAGDRRLGECRLVDVAEQAQFFGQEAEPIEFAAVDDQSPAIVAGRVVATDGRIGFEALMVQLSDRSDFKRIRGVVAEDAVDSAFRLVDSADSEETGIAVTVQPGALLFDQDGEILDAAVLQAGTPVRVMGRLLPAEGEGGASLLATAIAVDTTDLDETVAQVAGEITAIMPGRIDLALNDGGGDACVIVESGTEITVLEIGEDAVESRPGSTEDLNVGLQIEALGSTDDEGCIVAAEVVVEIDATDA